MEIEVSIDLLSRLRPEDVHPARLAGPHAWARWGLGPPPPTDHPLRFVVPAGATDASIDRILDAIQARLARASWPPRQPVRTSRSGSRLDVLAGTARSAVTVDHAPAAPPVALRPAGTVADPSGWFILDEAGGLADRLMVGGCDESLVEDLGRWAALKGAQVAQTQVTTPPIPAVLAELRRRNPAADDRLRTLLQGLGPETETLLPEFIDGLRYLRDEALSARRTPCPSRLPAVQ